MVKDHSVVFSDSQQPPAQRLERGKRSVCQQLSAAATAQTPPTQEKGFGICGGYLIVDLKFLDHSQLYEHPQSCRDHGVHIQREIVEGELVDAQFTDERDVGGLLDRHRRRHGGERELNGERGSDDTLDHGDMVIKTPRSSFNRLKMNEAARKQAVCTQSAPTNMTTQQIYQLLLS